MTVLRAAVSGSFHRSMPAIYQAVGDLRAFGVTVLSPSDPRVVDHLGEFLFVASDRLRSIQLVQDRHFEAIRAADFLWVVCPDGYTGASTSAEIGFAYGVGTPVFSQTALLDVTLQHYVRVVTSAGLLVRSLAVKSPLPANSVPHFLLDPDYALDTSILALERLKPILSGRGGANSSEAERHVDDMKRTVGSTIGLR